MSDHLATLMREADPARDLADVDVDRAWHHLIARVHTASRNRSHQRRVRAWVGAGSLGAVGAAVALVVSTLSVAPLSAAAAVLQKAARLDAAAATLPPLEPGQQMTQIERVAMTCQVGSPLLPAGSPLIAYDAVGTIASTTLASGANTVTITPTALGQGGSHFATPVDEARWEAAGRPFIPCALMNPANELGGNPANANPNPTYGGSASTVSGFGGFGFTIGWQTQAVSTAVDRVDALPNDPAELEAMLAAGEVAPDGVTSLAPQACPIAPTGTGSGCDPTQQLQIIAQLLMVPNASSKLGAALYDVAATLPGARLVGAVTTSLGQSGNEISVPLGTGETLELVIDRATGALLEASVMAGANEIARVSYGPISVS